MPTFFEQLRDAIAPEFLLERELGSGGMGTVFLARDTALDRLVAIKAMRPEDASARAVERFQNEAQTLAKLRHAHIVPVHSTGLARHLGTPFYVMDFLEGETLEQRLAQGPLPPADARRLCNQLLDALAAAHRHGIVHRDIKPSNVFLESGRAILTDFGISKRLDEPAPGLTAPGQAIGTPLYMPPEQSAGREVTPRTDLYAVGMVAYEALTGRQWSLETPGAVNWDGVPDPLRAVLARALSESPRHRWPDAESFARALAGATPEASMKRQRRAIGVLALLGGIAWTATHLPSRTPLADLRIDRLSTEDAGSAAYLGDSLAALVTRRLTGFPDFTVLGPGRSGPARSAVSGSISLAGSVLRVTMRLRDRRFVVSATSGDWRSVGDVLADSVLMGVYQGAALDSQLPVRVIPRSPEGLQAFLAAEKLFAAARWPEAYQAYGQAATVDSTCWLCLWRYSETRRWLGQDEDTVAIRSAVAHIALFPPQYQSLIRVDTLTRLVARLDTLDELHRRFPGFLFGEFRYGDELMHRGPLIGRPRREAAQHFQAALNIRPDFAPAVEHQLWLAVLEDQDSVAGAALGTLMGVAGRQALTSGVVELLETAFAWRFSPEAEASVRTRQAIEAATRNGVSTLDVGARYLNGFTAPRGAVWIGRLLEADPRYGRSALIAQAFGQLALGRDDSAASALDRLQTRFPDPALPVLRAELEALDLLFQVDSAAAASRARSLLDRLSRIASATSLPRRPRERAAWMVGILQCRFGLSSRSIEGPPALSPLLDGLLGACQSAEHGHLADAVTATAPFVELTAWPVREFPVYRSLLHLMRSDWLRRLGRPDAAAGELLWTENFDQATLPTGDPQPMDVDWALRPLARWKRALLLESSARREELCPLYATVVRLWHDGEPAFAARADSAARLASVRRCAEDRP